MLYGLHSLHVPLQDFECGGPSRLARVGGAASTSLHAGGGGGGDGCPLIVEGGTGVGPQSSLVVVVGGHTQKWRRLSNDGGERASSASFLEGSGGQGRTGDNM